MLASTLAPPESSSATASFPSAAVEAALRSELIEVVKAEAAIKGVTLPAAPAAIGTTPFRIDSLVVVSILCVVEPLLGDELPDSAAHTGGYVSVDQALKQVMSRIEAYRKKSKGGE